MWFLIVTLAPNVGPLGTLNGHILALGLYSFLFIKCNLRVPKRLKYVLVATVFFSVMIFFSIMFNINQTGIYAGVLKYFLVPFYWLFGLYASIIDAKLFKIDSKKFFFYIAAIFIVLQLPVALLQLLGAEGLTSKLWVAEKARDWTQTVRVVGTVQNPNTLGIISLLSIIMLVRNRKQYAVWSKVLITVCVLIIVLSGSRTSLLLLLLLPFFHIAKKRLLSRKSIYIVFSAFAVIFVAYFLLVLLQDSLPYMAQLLDFISGQNVNSLEGRFSHWAYVKQIYLSSPMRQVLFGLGPGFFTVLDNSYLYILFNYGIFGFLNFTALLFFLLRTSGLQNNKVVVRSIFLLIIAALVSDLMISFLFMTIIFYLIGYKSKITILSSGNKNLTNSSFS